MSGVLLLLALIAGIWADDLDPQAAQGILKILAQAPCADCLMALEPLTTTVGSQTLTTLLNGLVNDDRVVRTRCRELLQRQDREAVVTAQSKLWPSVSLPGMKSGQADPGVCLRHARQRHLSVGTGHNG